jgi:hypothetical protein
MFRAATSIKRFVSKSLVGKKALTLAAAAALSVPALAHADYRYDRGRDDRNSSWHGSDRRDDHRDYDHGHGGTNIDLNIRLGGGGPRPPEYREREVQVWVPATYRTVVDRKWVEPVYRTETERVWVPPVYEDREVHFIGERGRPRVRIDRVLVRDGYFENRERRVCVSEGHWENCERQELVCAGHYETHIERVRVPYRVDPLVVVNPGLGGIWHR